MAYETSAQRLARVDQYFYEKERDKSTFKQRKYYYYLMHVCKDNNINTDKYQNAYGRVGFADAISSMRKELHNANVPGFEMIDTEDWGVKFMEKNMGIGGYRLYKDKTTFENNCYNCKHMGTPEDSYYSDVCCCKTSKWRGERVAKDMTCKCHELVVDNEN